MYKGQLCYDTPVTEDVIGFCRGTPSRVTVIMRQVQIGEYDGTKGYIGGCVVFEKWKSIPRLNKEVIVTEKIDGTNAQIHIEAVQRHSDGSMPIEHTGPEVLATIEQPNGVVGEVYVIRAGSRSRYLSLEDDNFGFARWVSSNSEELFKFGPGRHYGEWYGVGIQRGYNLSERRLAMFNPRWAIEGPSVVDSTPVLGLMQGFDQDLLETIWYDLKTTGSRAVPGFMDPEGIVVYHTAANQMFKQTFEFDQGKWSGHE
jgi:hypothetical protein